MDRVTPGRREQILPDDRISWFRGMDGKRREALLVKVRAADKKTPREGGGITGRNPPAP
jgi:hypothetical protein